MDYLNQDEIYGDYQAIKLTKSGELYLYLIDNKEEIDKFADVLVQNGYDKCLFFNSGLKRVKI